MVSLAGLEVLTAMEKVEVDEDDRPKETISITGATVYVNPYRDEEAAEKKAAEEARLKVCQKRDLSNTLALACLLDCLGLWQLSKPLSPPALRGSARS